MAVPFPKRNDPKAPPEGLGSAGLALWNALTGEFLFEDAASLNTLASLARVEDDLGRLRARVATEGDTVTDRFEQLKAHPLLQSIRALEALKRQLMRALHILDAEPAKQPLGRPAFSPSRNR